MPSLADYLAKNYLTASNTNNTDSADTRPSKRRKKNKHSTSEATGTLVVADDDDDLLLSRGSNRNEVDDNDRPLMFDTKVRSAEFRKAKTNAWQTVSNGNEDSRGQAVTEQSSSKPKSRQDARQNEDEDEGDILLRETIASTAQSKAALDAENAPTIVETADSTQTTSDGIKAGLQTAADTARIIAAQEAREAREEQESRNAKKKKKSTTEEQTIYRDATGRRIDLTLRRQEAQRAEQARIKAEKLQRDQNLGETQLALREEAKQTLENAKFLTLARSADDEEMNHSLKQEMRWNDPMAEYMAAKQADEQIADKKSAKNSGAGSGGGKAQVKSTQYAGAAPPNRYGIKPGWRWDGVDRGNGFENQWFQARGKKVRNENLEYQWQMDE